MAEVLGAVASGIALAEIAMKLKSLLSQISDAPRTLESLADQVEIYAGMLSGLELGDILDTAISPSLRSSLRAAALQCHNAVNQLCLVVTDLSALSKTSYRRRKLAAIRFVLQKDSIVQFEHRLQIAVQCLAFAHQLYMFAWQKVQLPDVIVSRLQSQSTSVSPEPPMTNVSTAAPELGLWPTSVSVQPETSMSNVPSSKLRTSSLPNTCDSEKPSRGQGNEDDGDITMLSCSHSPDGLKSYQQTKEIRRQIYLPAWSSFYVFEIFAQHSYTGWKASLATYRVYSYHSDHYKNARKLVRTNDDREIYRALERGQFTLYDRFTFNGSDHSIAEIAFANGSWKACNYLLDIDRQALVSMGFYWRDVPEDEENMRHLEILLKRDQVPDDLRVSRFNHFVGDGVSFDRYRKQIWTDDEFYHDSFLIQRNNMAWILAFHSDKNISTHRFFRHVLSPLGALRTEDIYEDRLQHVFRDTLLHALAIAVSFIPWRMLKSPKEEQSSAYLKNRSGDSTHYIREALSDDWALLVFDMIPFWRDLHVVAPGWKVSGGITALFWSFATCFDVTEIPLQVRDRSRAMRFFLIEPSLKLWLTILRNAGIDLEEYGEKEAVIFSQASSSMQFHMHDVTFGEEIPRNDRGDYVGEDVFVVDLVGFQYGAEVDDWKLWWSEPTDVFVGDFWQLVESPYQPIPGAWIED